MNKLFEQNQIKDSQGKTNICTESLTPKESIDGETADTKVTSGTKGVEQLSMLEPRNKDGPQLLKRPHSRDGREYLILQNSGNICIKKKVVHQNDPKNSVLMSLKKAKQTYNDSDLNIHSRDSCVPTEIRNRDFKQLKLCEIIKQQSLSPSSTLCDLSGPRRKSEAHIYPKQPQTIVSTNASCRSHFISESSREQDRGKSYFSNFHHSPKTLNNKVSHHGWSETDQDVLQFPPIKPRRLPPLNPTRNRPDSQLKILKNVLSEATFISSSQEPQDTANDLFYPGLTKPSRQLSSSCNDQCMSVGYEHDIKKGEVPKHLEKIGRVQRRELPKCTENPFDGAVNQEIIKSLNSDIDVQIISQKERCASKKKRKSFQEEHLIPSNIYRNAPGDVDGLAEGLNKVHICNTNHTLAASRRKVAVCDSTDSAFRERMKTRALRKRFELTELSLESFGGNKSENTPPRTTFGCTTRIRRVGVCDDTDESLRCARMKLRTMQKRFGQTEEFGSEEKSFSGGRI